MPLPKPPKLFRIRSEATVSEPKAENTISEPITEENRVWSPSSMPTPPVTDFVPEPVEAKEEQTAFVPEPAEETATEQVSESEQIASENVTEQAFVPEPTEVPSPNSFTSSEQNAPQTPPEPEDFSRYARPTITQMTEVESVPEQSVATEEDVSETVSESTENDAIVAEKAPEEETEVPETSVKADSVEATEVVEKSVEQTDGEETKAEDLGNDSFSPIERYFPPNQKVVRAPSVSSVPFSDIWYTAEKIAYIRDKSTKFALVPFVTDDLEEFYKALEQGYTGQSSYAIRFAGESYRVERIITLSGAQYNCRKMPGSVPDIYTLGLPKHVVDYLLTLTHESGLILFGGPTGMGKTTSASALMKKFLEMEGGFMYTIEDPPEMPLDGLYHAKNGGLGLCKQCPVDNERWGDGIKSALRSRPRYILVGEIRTPETASQVLRAATSGHLVFSTIHASTVEDALESLIKYASGAGLTESLAADLLARGILAVIHQKLEGSTVLRPVLTTAFANPHLTGGDQMRSLIRSNNINLQTLVEAQSSRLFQGRPLFGDGEAD
ncbi:MAG: Flp pilus assembly complex ATPase component TadA [Alphaproteobacteria bacterium]|nr:Flp pilus assembly complex ATPase component TadA [Alphaproteobacteria bacterium]